MRNAVIGKEMGEDLVLIVVDLRRGEQQVLRSALRELQELAGILPRRLGPAQIDVVADDGNGGRGKGEGDRPRRETQHGVGRVERSGSIKIV